MKLSELQALFSKVNSIAGDVEVVLKSAEDEVETVITDLAVHLDPTTGATGGTLEVTHGAASPAPPPDPADAAADDTAPDS